MHRNRPSVALVDLVAIVVVGSMLLAIGVPNLSRARELSKRMVCSTNLAGIGGAGSIYTLENGGFWMIPAFKRALIDNGGIDYLAGSQIHTHGAQEPGEVGFERNWESRSETPLDPAGGSTAMSTTRAFWMLVRSGQANVKQFVCPSALDDAPDDTELIDLYYDFTDYYRVSYGYRVPFGPRETRPQEGADPRIVFVADKGPYYRDVPFPDFGPCCPYGPGLEGTPFAWSRFNSNNHGGSLNLGGDGQNAFYADGRVEFLRRPTGGADNDNIYTVIQDTWGALPDNRIYGDTPHIAVDPNPYPGQGAFGSGTGRYSSTDSLIYP